MLASIAKLRSWLPLARDVVALVIVTIVAAVTFDAAADCVFWRAYKSLFSVTGCRVGNVLRDVAPFIAIVVAMYWLPARWRRLRGVQPQSPSPEDRSLSLGTVAADAGTSKETQAGAVVTWSEGPDGEVCATCAYFRRYVKSTSPRDGICRRHPPQYSGPIIEPPPLSENYDDATDHREAMRQWRDVDRYEFGAEWSRPSVSAAIWCGEWRHHFTFRASCVTQSLTGDLRGPQSFGAPFTGGHLK